ncbi:DUF937 domain-containing protein [Ornithinimicrobium tianjinense]|uniref:DUF937 domain-containing protein n=1 Tax=Ornithinimicrobium tianjinense TaxID=1195761 RepID=A0A917F1Y2_9MICO|nr:DUF937 domain-containing protein [Ornithinimicrobium tianjinense]GGF45000.1 hypothetical protein GCM10011366_10890 [Ornithinimicrobium tianjinense]
MIDQLMRAIPTDEIARTLGTDEATATQAVQAALPALLGGLAANSESDEGARSLLEALGQHENGLADQVSLDAVDTTDGEKIVGHVFGNNIDGIANQLGGLGGAQTSGLVRRLLPILAPIVLSWLAKQMTGAGAGGRGTASPDRTAPGGSVSQPDGPLGQGRPESAPATDSSSGIDGTSILRDILGSALGSATGRTSSGGGSILGDVLGGLLGGRR